MTKEKMAKLTEKQKIIYLMRLLNTVKSIDTFNVNTGISNYDLNTYPDMKIINDVLEEDLINSNKFKLERKIETLEKNKPSSQVIKKKLNKYIKSGDIAGIKLLIKCKWIKHSDLDEDIKLLIELDN